MKVWPISSSNDGPIRANLLSGMSLRECRYLPLSVALALAAACSPNALNPPGAEPGSSSPETPGINQASGGSGTTGASTGTSIATATGTGTFPAGAGTGGSGTGGLEASNDPGAAGSASLGAAGAGVAGAAGFEAGSAGHGPLGAGGAAGVAGGP